MSESASGSGPHLEPSRERVFLVVIDATEEMSRALRYACRRARRTNGRVALLHVVQPADFQFSMAVADLMREERRAEAEQLLQRLAKEVVAQSGQIAILYLREGDTREELLKLIEEDASISQLVLAASVGPEGPGPLISYLVGKQIGRLRIPLTIVPGALSVEELDAVT